ncbi:hypothetical protein NA56DRAFT_700232 [Hyaloscypha hepaticicola]|uniref:Uncharacterized protein n=1 Tax=Hyaloscypha hepaticicola TaxID=2082293 RepID=A0A2J6QE97_9HELO|nr:hypothetical protein NA56DRAFT_700232 [Hyaloscypha hepaticicola]
MDIFLSEAEIELLEFADSCHPMAPDQIMLEPRLPANLEGIDGALEAKIALIESFFLLNGHLERDCFRVVYPHKLRTHQLVRMADLDPRRQDHERPETTLDQLYKYATLADAAILMSETSSQNIQNALIRPLNDTNVIWADNNFHAYRHAIFDAFWAGRSEHGRHQLLEQSCKPIHAKLLPLASTTLRADDSPHSVLLDLIEGDFYASSILIAAVSDPAAKIIKGKKLTAEMLLSPAPAKRLRAVRILLLPYSLPELLVELGFGDLKCTLAGCKLHHDVDVAISTKSVEWFRFIRPFLSSPHLRNVMEGFHLRVRRATPETNRDSCMVSDGGSDAIVCMRTASRSASSTDGVRSIDPSDGAQHL